MKTSESTSNVSVEMPFMSNRTSHRRWTAAIPPALALLLVAWVYWPVHAADFAWDDIVNYLQNDWLTEGDKWKHYVLRDFNFWTNYFRPLVVLMYTTQVRLFDVQPGPMHLVSLALHLLDCLLVGLLARIGSRSAGHAPRTQALWFAGSLLLYGLHPVLIEVVAWIGCQFDLTAVLFLLASLLASSTLRERRWRALAAGICYFLAACCKESTVVYPLLLLVFDWALQVRRNDGMSLAEFARAFIRRNTPVLLAMFAAGLAYLCFRWYGLGFLVRRTQMYGGDLGLSGDLQRSAYTLLQYARMLLWPTHALNPIHDVDFSQFERISPLLVAIMSAAIIVPVVSLYFALRYRSIMACIALAITVSILPVSNLAPIGYGVSLYQERYVINALAMLCVMLPLLRFPTLSLRPPLRLMLATSVLVWFAISILAIRSCLPLWKTDLGVWRWAYSQNATNHTARFNLISALIRRKMTDEADRVMQEIRDSRAECADCAMMVAARQIEDRTPLARAQYWLEYVRTAQQTATDRDLFGTYLMGQGQMALLQGDYPDAIILLQTHLQLAPSHIDGYIALGDALEKSGQHDRAVAIADKALSISPPKRRDKVAAWRQGIVTGTDKSSRR